MSGLRYIGISVLLAGLAAFLALDLSGADMSWLTFLSLENMCTDPDLREYVFAPFSCDAYNQIGFIEFDGPATFDSDERLLDLDAADNVIRIAQ
ncbi:MAG: hypothetical protein AAF801_03345 [Pseudomonadota bacterium]